MVAYSKLLHWRNYFSRLMQTYSKTVVRSGWISSPDMSDFLKLSMKIYSLTLPHID